MVARHIWRCMSPTPERRHCLLPPQSTTLAWSRLITGVIFSSCPRTEQTERVSCFDLQVTSTTITSHGIFLFPWKALGVWGRRRLSPIQTSSCIPPFTAQLYRCSCQHQWGKKGGQRLKPLQGLLLSAMAQAQEHIKQQRRRTVSPSSALPPPSLAAAPPTHTGIGIGSRSQAHVAGGCVSADLTAQLGLNTGISGVSHFISSFSTALVYNERNPLVIWQFQLLCTSDPISSFIYPDCYGMLVCWLYTSTSSVLI